MSKAVQVINATQRQSFSQEEKARIVADSYQSGLSLNQFAKRAGVSPSSLSEWRQQLKTGCSHETQGNYTPTTLLEPFNLPARVQQLETENKQLRIAFGQKLVEMEMMRMVNA